ncbi:hypothetical protein F7D20_01090 [Prevotella copri]|uniref:BIG2 domain-containing protein n=1 Tax=Segatella copri TaxID=165179 RepID=A0A6A7W7Z7_9BACT|nr:hypothetical protein [Segatella copri]MQP10583.1 hypothetical protein [Segatella copri]
MTPNLRLQIKEDFQKSKRTGFYTTASSKVAKKITISLASDHSANTTLQVYGSNTAYTSAEDIFDSEKCGTLLGEITKTKTDAIILSDAQSYKFIAVRAKGGAALINSISIEWASVSAEKTQTKLTFPKDSYSFSTTDDLSSFTGQTPTLKAGESELTGKTITYSKTGDDIFTSFDASTGTLALNGKAGTATVTASFSGDETYAASSASYTITVQDNRATPTFTFGKESYTFDLGATVAPFTNQLTAPEGVTVVYSSNSEIATVNETTGEVNVNTATVGKATITATFAGNETYAPATVSYTIEVKKPMLPPTFDFTQSENDYGSGATPGENYIETSTWTSGKVKMVTSKGNSQGFRWWQKTDGTVLRSYDGCSLTISVNKGLLINSIEFDGVISGFAADKGTLKSEKWTGSAQTVTFSFSAKKDIKSITVTYEKDATFTLETLTTAASGFATYAADYDVNYSALGLTTYTIALDEANNKVSYNRFEGVVPAGKAVLVQGTASTSYELTPAEGAADETFTTDLKASDGTFEAKDDKVYAFGTLNGKSGFKLVNNGVVIPAKKGYLQLTGTTAAKPTFFAFDGIGTGISHIEADAALENAAMYNLAGQRVDKSYKGVVIVNGKKMLRK